MIKWPVIYTFLGLLFIRVSEMRQWSEKALIKDLLHDYEKRARPVVDGVSKTVPYGMYYVQQITVEFGLSLIQILDLNENEQTLTVSIKLIYRWQDHHLIWNPEDYDNITDITIPTSKLWMPDIALYNYADERPEEKRECAARVSHNGTIEWYPMAIIRSTCPVKIKYFPYDRQNCTLRFGPWSYDSARVNISFSEKNFDTDDYIASTEWNLTDYRARVKIRKYICCPEVYVDMLFEILIERQPAYYNHLLILPCFLLSAVTMVLFWLPPETPAKMVLGLNIFVAFFLLLLLLNDSIPSASSSYPLIGNYYCINMILVIVSTFFCLTVVNLHFRGDRQGEVPPWLKKLALQHGARFLFVNVNPPKPPGSPARKSSSTKDTDRHLFPRSSFHPGAGIHFTDIPPYPHLRLPVNAQSLPIQQRFHYPPNDFPNSQRHDSHMVVQRYPLTNNPPYNPSIEYPNMPLNSYPDWTSSRPAPAGTCSFCPACAGLAAAAAATGVATGENDMSDDLAMADQGFLAPSPMFQPSLPSVQYDPTEQLAAVWAAAMTGSNPQVEKAPFENDEDEDADDDGEEDVDGDDDEEPDDDEDELVHSSTSIRKRSVDPELECFLLECIRPQSTEKAINQANARWSGGRNQPSSPFYEFNSPHCEEEEQEEEEQVDESSENDWPIRKGHVTSGHVVEDGESEASNQVPELWRTNSMRPPHKGGDRTAAMKDKHLLKRVQRVRRDVSEIVRGIRFMQKINKKKERINEIIAEWRVFGMVLDRFFFLIYVCALGISIIMYFPRSGNDEDRE